MTNASSVKTKRFLITGLLAANAPDHENWATDYDSIIVSNGELYNNSALALSQVTQTPHLCTGRGNDSEPVRVDSFVTYLGQINLKGLKAYVENGSDFEDVADVLKSLNIISWKNINKPDFEGGRVGNRFYPRERKGKMKAVTTPDLYQIRDGFLSSMRPGSGSLLLNVNTVTSAFFSPMNLQDWIEKCWAKETLEGNLVKYFRSKFKGIRVTLDIHDSSRLWQICGMSPRTVRHTSFLQENVPSFVSSYLRTSKFHDPMELWCFLIWHRIQRQGLSKDSMG